MAQNEERARAVKQARKLMGMTMSNGASEAEAETAMKRLALIRSTYNLTLDEIVLATLEYQTREVISTATKGCPLDTLVPAIARFTDTKAWREPGKRTMRRYINKYGRPDYRMQSTGPASYKFFGIDSDVEMAVYLYNLLSQALKTAEKKFTNSLEYKTINRRGGKRSALVSFRKGFVRRVYYRLDEITCEQENTFNVESSGSDIVLVKEKVREEKFQEMLGIRLVKRPRYDSGISNGSAFGAGREAANTVNFNRPVGGSSSNLKLLA